MIYDLISLFGNDFFLLIVLSVFFILLAYALFRIKKILRSHEIMMSNLQKNISDLNTQLSNPSIELKEELELLKENQLKLIEKIEKKGKKPKTKRLHP